MRPPPSTSVAITDPLVKYQSMLATGVYSPDPAQHRLALHLQKVYRRLKDYAPSAEYRERLNAITGVLDRNQTPARDRSAVLATPSHPIRRNPLLARFLSRAQGQSQDSRALTRVLTSHDQAIQVDSPQGLFLSGEVGTGKSMLTDLLADGLPNSRKRRWHFNTFMLYTFSQLESFRKAQQSQADGADENYSLLWMARDMIEKSPILFLDEFQLPDRAASKILSNLFTVFFQLGGVLIASSNRMPEELERATGFEYAVPSTVGRITQALGLRGSRSRSGRGELFGSSSDFATFLEVLKARCEFHQMDGGQDWRRREVEAAKQRPVTSGNTSSTIAVSEDVASASSAIRAIEEAVNESGKVFTTPKNFFLLEEVNRQEFQKALTKELFTGAVETIPWQSTTLTVYGRSVTIPQLHDGVVFWDFADLVSSFGPADYITMASNFHTFIIDQVPVLSILKKNEARRLITLLDALYEARCKLVIRAAAGPDDLFFPEARSGGSWSNAPSAESELDSPGNSADGPPRSRIFRSDDVVDADAIHSETVAEAYQDQMSPFRPNISSYTGSSNTSYDPDQDSDFGLEEEELRIRKEQQQKKEQQQDKTGGRAVNFSNTSAFTGEDERFAYKRAASRLWELCSAQWHARDGEGWWQPLPREARHWEGSGAGASSAPSTTSSSPHRSPGRQQSSGGNDSDVRLGPAVELDEVAGLQGLRVEALKREMEEEAEREEKGAAVGGRV